MPPYPNLFGTPLAKYVPNFMLLSQNAQLFWLSDCYIKMHNCFGYLLHICCIVIVILKNGCRGCHVENSGCLHIQIYSGHLWLQMYQISCFYHKIHNCFGYLTAALKCTIVLLSYVLIFMQIFSV